MATKQSYYTKEEMNGLEKKIDELEKKIRKERKAQSEAYNKIVPLWVPDPYLDRDSDVESDVKSDDESDDESLHTIGDDDDDSDSDDGDKILENEQSIMINELKYLKYLKKHGKIRDMPSLWGVALYLSGRLRGTDPSKLIAPLIIFLVSLAYRLKSTHDANEKRKQEELNKSLLNMNPKELIAWLPIAAARVIEQTSHINAPSTFKYALPFLAVIVAIAGANKHWSEIKQVFQSYLDRRHIGVKYEKIRIPTSNLKARFWTIMKRIGFKSKGGKSKSKSTHLKSIRSK